MAVASNLLFVGGVPSDFWEECLPASLCCAPIHASIDKKCMESVSACNCIVCSIMHSDWTPLGKFGTSLWSYALIREVPSFQRDIVLQMALRMYLGDSRYCLWERCSGCFL